MMLPVGNPFNITALAIMTDEITVTPFLQCATAAWAIIRTAQRNHGHTQRRDQQQCRRPFQQLRCRQKRRLTHRDKQTAGNQPKQDTVIQTFEIVPVAAYLGHDPGPLSGNGERCIILTEIDTPMA